jgi:hypothetical protein
MCSCEDRPCCGHPAEERADDAYWAEKLYSQNPDYADYEDYEEE